MINYYIFNLHPNDTIINPLVSNYDPLNRKNGIDTTEPTEQNRSAKRVNYNFFTKKLRCNDTTVTWVRNEKNNV